MDRYLPIFNYWETVIKHEIWGTPLSEKKYPGSCHLELFIPSRLIHTHTPKITKRKSRDSSGIVKVVGFSKNDQKSGFIETVGCDDVIIVSVPSGNFRWLARQSKGLSIARQN